jgi:hypothetical protein
MAEGVKRGGKVMMKEELEKQVHEFAELIYEQGFEDGKEKGIEGAWEYEERHDCENCAKAISAECVVDGCEFEPKQNEKLCDRCKKSKLCELSYLKYVNTCSDFCPKTDATDIDDGSIKVGDEVSCPQIDSKGIVIQTANKDTLLVLTNSMDGLLRTDESKVARTGRQFPQIAEVLKQLRGEEE